MVEEYLVGLIIVVFEILSIRICSLYICFLHLHYFFNGFDLDLRNQNFTMDSYLLCVLFIFDRLGFFFDIFAFLSVAYVLRF